MRMTSRDSMATTERGTTPYTPECLPTGTRLPTRPAGRARRRCTPSQLGNKAPAGAPDGQGAGERVQLGQGTETPVGERGLGDGATEDRRPSRAQFGEAAGAPPRPAPGVLDGGSAGGRGRGGSVAARRRRRPAHVRPRPRPGPGSRTLRHRPAPVPAERGRGGRRDRAGPLPAGGAARSAGPGRDPGPGGDGGRGGRGRGLRLHPGVDVTAVVRALAENLSSGRVVQGGSTITQQLVKNAFTDGDRTLQRKLDELRLALQVDRSYDKEEILAAYLNSTFFGEGAIGIEAAARTYLRKPAHELSLGEAALLAGIIPAPSETNPRHAPQRAEARRQVVLDRVAEAGLATPDEIAAARAEVPHVYGGGPRSNAIPTSSTTSGGGWSAWRRSPRPTSGEAGCGSRRRWIRCYSSRRSTPSAGTFRLPTVRRRRPRSSIPAPVRSAPWWGVGTGSRGR